MLDDSKDLGIVNEDSNEKTLKPISLDEESKALISQIVAETDDQKTKDLVAMFNTNQNKKTMVRVNKLSELLDAITNQALTRFTTKPDEISNKELFDGLKVVQDLIERGQKQVSGVGETPLIQVNQQTNEVNIGNTSESLNRESRERVKSVVLDLLNNITSQDSQPVVDAAIVTDELITEEENPNDEQSS